ncbi:rhodopsin-like, partial [Mizuhopecten yessoensis]|uniref:rhodopsin-like n=1 Tax=Mizuhopecten yessoensis TaxID=6573 RepID=UPI000B45D5F8
MEGNNTTNGSSLTLDPEEEYYIPDIYYNMFAVILFFTWILGSFFNGSALLVFFKNKNLRTATNMFVMALAVDDLAMSSICLFAASASYNKRWIHGDLICTIEGFLVYVLGLTDLYLLCAISLDRYIVIAKPLQANKINHGVAALSITACWMGGLFWSATPFFGWNYYRLEDSGVSCGVSFEPNDPSIQSYILSIFIFCFVGPFVLIMFSYYGVYMT